MKKSLIIILSLFYSFVSFGQVSIITDFDDTVKVTGDFPQAIISGLFTRKVYLGIPEFLQATQNYINEMHIVTASPKIVKFNVKRLLKKHDIRPKTLTLNRNIKRPPKFDYKVAAIEHILSQTSDDIILIGDDVGEDPEIYDEMMNRYPERILASYIHVVKNRSLPLSVKPYWTTFELGAYESLSDRLPSEVTKNLGEKVLAAAKLKTIFPKFAHCPTNDSVWQWLNTTEFAEISHLVSDRLISYCSQQ
jgi:hypothetical protein